MKTSIYSVNAPAAQPPVCGPPDTASRPLPHLAIDAMAKRVSYVKTLKKAKQAAVFYAFSSKKAPVSGRTRRNRRDPRRQSESAAKAYCSKLLLKCN
ncbi:MAG: hypothetical protein JO171_18635 [Paludibacterium sp.]|uniref:hypothetical protein n=1 Tax=Paludibacterium sp. TaxID=1917523 RepID=UPI0025D98F0C|nr:hypothetical protein [Paludibacterium sp.]MBV8049172.1 hypothetical protein [Paludibacterium sp.]MBV8646207.1 hypothetical protein [Paludibacterium sp.]